MITSVMHLAILIESVKRTDYLHQYIQGTYKGVERITFLFLKLELKISRTVEIIQKFVEMIN